MAGKIFLGGVVVSAAILGICLISGCQSAINGQVLPSATYMTDDVQYFPAGPEFKLPKEAAALRAARAEEKAAQARTKLGSR